MPALPRGEEWHLLAGQIVQRGQCPRRVGKTEGPQRGPHFLFGRRWIEQQLHFSRRESFLGKGTGQQLVERLPALIQVPPVLNQKSVRPAGHLQRERQTCKNLGVVG